MGNIIQEISLILVNDYKILDKILLLADNFGVDESEKRNLKVELRRGGVDYYDCIKTLLQGWVSTGVTRSLQDLLGILNTMDCVAVAEILQDKFPRDALLLTANAGSSTATRQMKRAWNVINPVLNFVGREEEILQLQAFLEDESKRLLVISGIGGQGKTQLCRQLIKELQKSANCPLIIWLAGESGEALTSSLINCIKKMTRNDELKIKTFEEALELALTSVEDEESVLWIMDNINTEYNEIEKTVKHFLTRMGNSKIVITSRLRTLLAEDAEYLILQTLSPGAAHELIRNGISGNLEEEVEVKTLCEEMGYHALALQLSIGFIRGQRIGTAGGKKFGIPDFLIHFNKDKKTFLDKTEKLTTYEKNIFHHVRQFMSLLEETNENLAKEILLILSLFRHDGVDLEFLLKTFSAVKKCKKPSYWFTVLGLVGIMLSPFRSVLLELDFLLEIILVSRRKEVTGNSAQQLKKAVNLLHSLSLVDAGSLQAITIHPLIQETTRILFPPEWMAVADSILSKVTIRNLSVKNLSHILRLWEIGGREDTLLRKYACLMPYIYKRLYDTSQVQALIPFTSTHIENVFRALRNPGNKVEIMIAEMLHGKAHIQTGEYQKGYVLLEASHVSACQVLGKNHPFTISRITEMIDVLVKLDRAEEAVILYQEILPRIISVYGEKPLLTMETKFRYADALSHCGRSSEAIEFYEEVLRWNVQNVGSTHPDTLFTRHNIACSHLKKGNAEKAISEFKAVLEPVRTILGEKHPQTLNVRGWMAKAYFESENYEKAHEVFESLVKHSKEVLGHTHPNTLTYRHNNTFCLLKLGKKEEAITELEDMLELKIQKLGRKHPCVEDTRALLHYAQTDQSEQTFELMPNVPESS